MGKLITYSYKTGIEGQSPHVKGEVSSILTKLGVSDKDTKRFVAGWSDEQVAITPTDWSDSSFCVIRQSITVPSYDDIIIATMPNRNIDAGPAIRYALERILAGPQQTINWGTPALFSLALGRGIEYVAADWQQYASTWETLIACLGNLDPSAHAITELHYNEPLLMLKGKLYP